MVHCYKTIVLLSFVGVLEVSVEARVSRFSVWVIFQGLLLLQAAKTFGTLFPLILLHRLVLLYWLIVCCEKLLLFWQILNIIGDSTSRTTPYIHDPTSPLFLLHSYVPGISLISVRFSGTGFGGWKRNMIVSRSAKNKIGFIDGSCTKPAEDSPQYRQWDRCNNMVISWLTNFLSSDIVESVQYSKITESIWN